MKLWELAICLNDDEVFAIAARRCPTCASEHCIPLEVWLDRLTPGVARQAWRRFNGITEEAGHATTH